MSRGYGTLMMNEHGMMNMTEDCFGYVLICTFLYLVRLEILIIPKA